MYICTRRIERLADYSGRVLRVLKFYSLAAPPGAIITAVASTDGVYHSTDFGKTFTKGTLPSGNSYRSIAGKWILLL